MLEASERKNHHMTDEQKKAILECDGATGVALRVLERLGHVREDIGSLPEAARMDFAFTVCSVAATALNSAPAVIRAMAAVWPELSPEDRQKTLTGALAVAFGWNPQSFLQRQREVEAKGPSAVH